MSLTETKYLAFRNQGNVVAAGTQKQTMQQEIQQTEESLAELKQELLPDLR